MLDGVGKGDEVQTVPGFADHTVFILNHGRIQNEGNYQIYVLKRSLWLLVGKELEGGKEDVTDQ